MASRTGENSLSPNTFTGSSRSHSDIQVPEDDELGAYLTTLAQSQSQSIEKYHPQRIVDNSINVLTYWNTRSSEFPMLYKIAFIIHGVPATQVSVERAISALNFIFSDRRNRLSSEHIQQILLVR